jgi:hypothetical protein
MNVEEELDELNEARAAVHAATMAAEEVPLSAAARAKELEGVLGGLRQSLRDAQVKCVSVIVRQIVNGPLCYW